MLVVEYPIISCKPATVALSDRASLLFPIVRQEGQIEDQGDPVSIHKEEDGQECVDGSFGYNVRIETIAEIDRIYIITVFRVSKNLSEHPRGYSTIPNRCT